MTKIIYVEHNGAEHEVDLDNEMNLMEGATLNMVPGVDGMCGGICSCATCHCYIEDKWKNLVSEPSQTELGLLKTAKFRQDNSRLGCQVVVTSEMEGMRVYLPQEQGSED